MTNDIITSEDANYNPFEELGKECSGQHIIGTLLKFSKAGKWIAGKDADLVPMGTKLIAYMAGLHDGWIFWNDGRPERYDMGLVTMNRPKYGSNRYQVKTRAELGDLEKEYWDDRDGQKKDPWQRTFILIMVDPDTEELYTYNPSSDGGRKAIGALSAALAKHNKMRDVEERRSSSLVVRPTNIRTKNAVKSRSRS